MDTKSDIKVELATRELRPLVDDVRKAVFVKECGIPAQDDFDGNDEVAAHILAYKEENNQKLPVGTMRIRFFGGFVKFERMAVLPEFRKTDLTNRIMQYGFDYVSIKGFREVRGMCKKDLLPRWQKCGFEECPRPFLVHQNGMDLVEIRRLLPPNPKAAILASSPELLIAPEGHWFDDGRFTPAQHTLSEQPHQGVSFLHNKNLSRE